MVGERETVYCSFRNRRILVLGRRIEQIKIGRKENLPSQPLTRHRQPSSCSVIINSAYLSTNCSCADALQSSISSTWLSSDSSFSMVISTPSNGTKTSL